MGIRERRLLSEYERIKLAFVDHPRISIANCEGNPPERYVIEYRVKSLVESDSGVEQRDVHQVEVTLGREYPRQAPRCVMLTPVFHPNIDHLGICTEDIGAAGQTLDRTLVFIAEMLTFQSYNLQSPRNGEAARWVKEHEDHFPLEDCDFFPHVLMTLDVQTLAAQAAANVPGANAPIHDVCSNCRQPGATTACVHGHGSCPDCAVQCAACGRPLCLSCVPRSCVECGVLVCDRCSIQCQSCNAPLCSAHAHGLCPSCRSSAARQIA